MKYACDNTSEEEQNLESLLKMTDTKGLQMADTKGIPAIPMAATYAATSINKDYRQGWKSERCEACCHGSRVAQRGHLRLQAEFSKAPASTAKACN